MNRKGPDGRTLPPAGGEETEDTTRRMPKRSIRDRIAGADPDGAEETRAVHRPVATEPVGGQDEGDYAETRLAPGAPPVGETVRSDRPNPRMESGEASGGASGDGGDGPNYVSDSGASQPNATTPAEPAPQPSATPPPVDAEVTQVYRPKGKQSAAAAAPLGEEDDDVAGGDDLVADPVVGWMVVIEGPGRGSALTIGYGNNRIGRDEGEDIVLDFGDGQISRENHAIVTFDGKNRKFYIQQGGGRNLTHVNDDLVLTPMELTGGEVIQMGETKVRFVPLCGSDFDWYDE